jgi:S-adenosylmethionine/arginine decarboxylase-like enzyme
VLGTCGESPPGFTAALLIDESHVTAHSYSEKGWLAIDVFTCGAHDPQPLATQIRRRIEAYAPAVRCAQHATMRRFLHAPDRCELPACSPLSRTGESVCEM